MVWRRPIANCLHRAARRKRLSKLERRAGATRNDAVRTDNTWSYACRAVQQLAGEEQPRALCSARLIREKRVDGMRGR